MGIKLLKKFFGGNSQTTNSPVDDYNGTETLTFPNGAKYVGEFKDGKRNGTGTQTFPDAANYVGGFKDDKYNGTGTFTFPDGAKYIGEFKDNKMNRKHL